MVKGYDSAGVFSKAKPLNLALASVQNLPPQSAAETGHARPVDDYGAPALPSVDAATHVVSKEVRAQEELKHIEQGVNTTVAQYRAAKAQGQNNDAATGKALDALANQAELLGLRQDLPKDLRGQAYLLSSLAKLRKYDDKKGTGVGTLDDAKGSFARLKSAAEVAPGNQEVTRSYGKTIAVLAGRSWAMRLLITSRHALNMDLKAEAARVVTMTAQFPKDALLQLIRKNVAEFAGDATAQAQAAAILGRMDSSAVKDAQAAYSEAASRGDDAQRRHAKDPQP